MSLRVKGMCVIGHTFWLLTLANTHSISYVDLIYLKKKTQKYIIATKIALLGI